MLQRLPQLAHKVMIRLKIQFRIPGYYLVIPWILFLLLSVVHEPPMSGLVLAGGVITQTLIFLGMIMGYRGGLRDRKQGGEYLFLFPGSYTAGWLSILAEWCFFILIQIPVFLYIFWRGIAGGEESWYFKQTFLYLVLYFLLPLILNGMIGRILSFWGEKRGFYLLMVFIGLLTGPMMHTAMEIVFSFLLGNKMGKAVSDLLCIGQSGVGTGMDLFYGLQIEKKRFFHLLFLLMAELFVYGVGLNRMCPVISADSFRQKGRNTGEEAGHEGKRKKGKTGRTEENAAWKREFYITLVFAALTVLFLAGYLRPAFLPGSADSHNDLSDMLYDYNYYKAYTDEEPAETERSGLFKINRITGTVDTRQRLSFNGIIEGQVTGAESESDSGSESESESENEQKIKTLMFRLYHDLKIKELSGDGILSFEQEGDIVRICYEKELSAGDPVRFWLRYEGNSSPLFYSNERAVFLPGWFNWLPCPGEGNAMRVVKEKEDDMDRLFPVPVFIENDCFYDLSFLGSYAAYSNLNYIKADAGSGSDTGFETDAGFEADTGAEPDAGFEADTGSKPDSGSGSDYEFELDHKSAGAPGAHFCGISGEGVYFLSSDHMRVYPFEGGEIVSCIRMTEEFARRAGNYYLEQLGMPDPDADGIRILLVPHHIFGNVSNFDYAAGNTVYSDVENWYRAQDYDWQTSERILKRNAENALKGFGKEVVTK